SLFAQYSSTTLAASGLDVGLPDGQMGNSEVGHLNIGAGRIIYQDLTKISKSIADGDFFTNPALLAAMQAVAGGKGKLHLMGLLSDGGVHSHNTHLYALIRMAKAQGVAEILVHPFLDGRDTPPRSAAQYLAELETEMVKIGGGRIATIIGRYYAMDRDNRWDRVERAWRALVQGEGQRAADSATAIAAAYNAGQNDEFVEPWIIAPPGQAAATMHDHDTVIFFNFRSDRAREITRALIDPDFTAFTRSRSPQLAAYVCMAEYDETLPLPVAFPSESYPQLLGEVVAAAGLAQLRIAETEKYAHVTFFFNGGSEVPSPGEDRVLIPSPQEVATYDQQPAMSAVAVTDAAIERLQSGRYALIILNFANPDMVGHTGIMPAAITAMETVDACIGRLVAALLAAGGTALITADHGNCEQMTDAVGKPHTAHTSNRVPLLLVDAAHRALRQDGSGRLADLAPTVLELLDLPQPAAMTGKSLLQS
ncbi:MAG: 2,3-bisphosphoglycerate-independent phosphoglycerate mutase, partial [Desulfuromonadales bacterium]|nr:2,3-bisphosphoglycerate-independent phosphoglycerate mutase [Desulfuromonadales bacterium]